MSPDRDVTRIVRSWLNEDRHEDADRVLDTVLNKLDSTPQRRSWWSAWRFPLMSNSVSIALAAAAVVVVALIGYQFLVAPKVGDPGPVETPTPTSEPTATPAPSPTSAAVVFPPAGELATTDRHSMTLEGVQFTFSVPAGGSATASSASTGQRALVPMAQASSSGSMPPSAFSAIRAARQRDRHSGRPRWISPQPSRQCPAPTSSVAPRT